MYSGSGQLDDLKSPHKKWLQYRRWTALFPWQNSHKKTVFARCRGMFYYYFVMEKGRWRLSWCKYLSTLFWLSQRYSTCQRWEFVIWVWWDLPNCHGETSVTTCCGFSLLHPFSLFVCFFLTLTRLTNYFGSKMLPGTSWFIWLLCDEENPS